MIFLVRTMLGAIIALVVAASISGAQCPAAPNGDPVNSPALVTSTVADERPFYGLAIFYGTVTMLAHDGVGWRRVDVPTGRHCLVAARGRYDTLVGGFDTIAEDYNGDVRLTGERLVLVQEEALTGSLLGGLRFLVWGPIAVLANGLGSFVSLIYDLSGLGWGGSIVLLAFLMRVLLWPISRATLRAQAIISKQEAMLSPRVAEIKQLYKGEDAHYRIIGIHKELGISPFFRLKSVIGPALQVPILVAIFTLLGGMEQLRGESFLWVEDLSMPDRIAMLPAALPMLGDRVSLLPVLMTLFALTAVVWHRHSNALPERRRASRRNMILLTLLFFVLFYPFPSAMVLYWTSANAAQLLEHILLANHERT